VEVIERRDLPVALDPCPARGSLRYSGLESSSCKARPARGVVERWRRRERARRRVAARPGVARTTTSRHAPERPSATRRRLSKGCEVAPLIGLVERMSVIRVVLRVQFGSPVTQQERAKSLINEDRIRLPAASPSSTGQEVLVHRRAHTYPRHATSMASVATSARAALAVASHRNTSQGRTIQAITHRRRRPGLHALNANRPCGPGGDTSCVELDEACMAAEHSDTAASVGDHGKESRAGQHDDDTTEHHSFNGSGWAQAIRYTYLRFEHRTLPRELRSVLTGIRTSRRR
jgi:hypothetical protein